MTTTLLLMTCALAAPADSPTAAPTVMAAPMLEAGGGCGGCGLGGGGACAGGVCPGTMDPCPFEKKGLFAKLRNAFRPKGKCVECIPSPAKDKSQKLLFGRFHRPVNYCGAGGCGTGGSGGAACSSCALPPIPGSMPVTVPAATAPAPVTAPAPAPAPAPTGEGRPATGKVNVTIPGVPAAMPAPAGKPAF